MEHQAINSRDGFVYDMRLYCDCSFPLPHIHGSAELLYVLRGTARITVNAAEWRVPAGQCALVLPYRLHSFVCAPDTVCVVHVFSRDCAPMFFRLLRNQAAAAPVFVPDPADAAYYREKFGVVETAGDAHETVPLADTDDFVRARPQTERYGNTIPPRTQLGRIAALEGMLSGYLAGTRQRDTAEDPVIERIFAYVGAHSGEEGLTLATTAAALGYEPHYLCRRMKQYTTVGFRTLVNSFRVEQAKELLSGTALSATTIAATCGFGTLRTFNRVFRACTGQTPSEYRGRG